MSPVCMCVVVRGLSFTKHVLAFVTTRVSVQAFGRCLGCLSVCVEFARDVWTCDRY